VTTLDLWLDQEPAEIQANQLSVIYAHGIHENLSNEEYHASQPIGSTGLKRILQSPAHFKYPNPFNATRAKEIGTAIHCAILEPERFEADYRIVECDARTSPFYKAACKDVPKDRVLTSLEYENVAGMKRGVMRNPKTRKLIEAPGRYELSLFTRDPETGVDVKVRYDKLTVGGMPIDLKKTQEASRDKFSRTIHSYGYHVSAAIYMDAWQWQFGETLDVMRWIAVEEQSPHTAMRYMPDADSLMIGRALYREALQIYANCLDRDEWPSYDDQEEEIALPYYALRDADEVEIDFGGDE
jgi:exodeoxyribonuclease VIII